MAKIDFVQTDVPTGLPYGGLLFYSVIYQHRALCGPDRIAGLAHVRVVTVVRVGIIALRVPGTVPARIPHRAARAGPLDLVAIMMTPSPRPNARTRLSPTGKWPRIEIFNSIFKSSESER